MAADEGSNQTKASERGFCKTPNLNVTIGAGDDDDPDAEEELEMFDMRSRMQSFALDDGSVMPPTIFVDDSDMMLLPTTSSSLLQESSPSGGDVAIIDDSESNMQRFVKDFFAADNRLFQAPDAGNFVEEIFTEKPPKFIGDYLFGNVIGEGSYSKVKEILHTKTLERRAVKIIKDKRLRKIPGGEQNVQREIEVLKRIHHVNVVELFEVFRIEEKQKLYIVMEFCVCSLQQMLDNCEEKKLPEFQAHIYFTQMIDGLDYLHAQGIIHKDIKPGNLLLSLDGKVKICDMGVAEVLHDGESHVDPRDDWCTTPQGTPKFQPPEVVSGSHRRFRGRPVDIWACGVTLFNVVSGEYPFEGDVIMKLFENITTQPLILPTTIKLSDSLAKLLRGMLEKHPEKRWNTVRIRQADWFTRKHEIEISRIVKVPETWSAGIVCAAHRPLGIYPALEQLYESFDDEGENLGDDNAIKASTQYETSEERCPAELEAKTVPTMKESECLTERKETVKPADTQRRKSSSATASGASGGLKFWKLFRWKNLKNSFQKSSKNPDAM
ncbi:protein kinase domain-containing protein [Ditylenchus destructor]|uniref:non-specific serine/threonine protein kinase n=1 Tax=Ditylenchus destructor TaxID=166010 RepID=A0AAD4NDF3_9BILA|nr:protein kinase domain-containing protein [Ditylenchus destructor]